MSRALILLSLTAVVAVPAAGVASPRARTATTCHAPGSVGGVHVTSVTAHGISCETAVAHTRRYIAHGSVHTYTCTTHVSGRSVRLHCTSGDHSFGAAWSVH